MRLVPVVGMMLALAAGDAARAQDAGYSTNLPRMAQLQRDYRVADAGETRARLAAACHTLTGVMTLFMGERLARRDFVLHEEDLFDAYGDCVSAQLKGASPAVTTRAAALGADETFRQEVIHRYLAAADLERYGRLVRLNPAAQTAQNATDDAWRRDHQARIDAAEDVRLFGPIRALLPFTLAAVVFSLSGLALLLLSLRPVRLDARAGSLHAGGRRYDVNTEAGVVLAHNQEKETTLTPGTITYNGQGQEIGRTAPSVQVTHHDILFVTTAALEEKAIRLINWRVNARAGHRLGVMWATRGQRSGDYLAVWNFSLESVQTNSSSMRLLFSPSLLACFLIPVGVFLFIGLRWPLGACFTWAGVAFVGLMVFRYMVGAGRAARFEREALPEIRTHVAHDAELAERRVATGSI